MKNLDPVEQTLLLEGIYHRYGYDFRKYAEASFHRRLLAVMGKFGIEEPFEFLKKIIYDPDFFKKVLPLLTISTTELFRDPEVFKQLREKVLPVLKTYPHLNVWIAGCSTGEEVYSLSILLNEEGLAPKTTIYATDINPQSLETARKGVYALASFQTFVKNYTLAGGRQAPSDYYIAEYSTGRFNSQLRENVVFAEHNLVNDQSFREMHLILCRNVLIYFNHSLQDRVLRLFYESLVHRGFLVLGSKETTQFSSFHSHFVQTDLPTRIFQKSQNREFDQEKHYEA